MSGSLLARDWSFKSCGWIFCWNELSKAFFCNTNQWISEAVLSCAVPHITVLWIICFFSVYYILEDNRTNKEHKKWDSAIQEAMLSQSGVWIIQEVLYFPFLFFSCFLLVMYWKKKSEIWMYFRILRIAVVLSSGAPAPLVVVIQIYKFIRL